MFLSKWFDAFQPVLEYARTPAGCAYFLPTMMLLFHYRSLEFVEQTFLNLGEETCYDIHLDAMKSCISLLRLVLTSENSQHGENKSHAHPCKTRFTFEMHYLPVMFLIAVKCRDFETRREVVELLETYPVREGLWDSGLVVAVAKRCIDIEEEGLAWGAFVPDEKRMRIVGTEIIFSERKTIFKYMVPCAGTREMEVVWPYLTSIRGNRD